jgi:hypothetical protein
MANQTSSPKEAEIAQNILKQMGETWEQPKQSSDPYQNINYSDKRGTYESEETFRQRRQGSPFGRGFDYRRYSQQYEDIFGKGNFDFNDFFRQYATGPRPDAGARPRGGWNDADQALYQRQRRTYERLLALFRDFRDDMDGQEYGMWEKLLQQIDPNGIYFTEKIMKRQQARANDYHRGYEYGAERNGPEHQFLWERFIKDQVKHPKQTFADWQYQNYGRVMYDSKPDNAEEPPDPEMQAAWQRAQDEKKRKEEAAQKAEQKIKDERERRERDEAMGAFDKWFHEFKKGRG